MSHWVKTDPSVGLEASLEGWAGAEGEVAGLWALSEGLAGNLVVFVSNEAQQLLLLATEGKMGFGLVVGYSSSVQPWQGTGSPSGLSLHVKEFGWDVHLLLRYQGIAGSHGLRDTCRAMGAFIHPLGISDIPLHQDLGIPEHTAVTE